MVTLFCVYLYRVAFLFYFNICVILSKRSLYIGYDLIFASNNRLCCLPDKNQGYCRLILDLIFCRLLAKNERSVLPLYRHEMYIRDQCLASYSFLFFSIFPLLLFPGTLPLSRCSWNTKRGKGQWGLRVFRPDETIMKLRCPKGFSHTLHTEGGWVWARLAVLG